MGGWLDEWMDGWMENDALSGHDLLSAGGTEISTVWSLRRRPSVSEGSGSLPFPMSSKLTSGVAHETVSPLHFSAFSIAPADLFRTQFGPARPPLICR